MVEDGADGLAAQACRDVTPARFDDELREALGVDLASVDQIFSTAWGAKYINNFFDTDNRIKRVYVQADAPYRMLPANKYDTWREVELTFDPARMLG